MHFLCVSRALRGYRFAFDPRKPAKIRDEKNLISVLQLGTVDYATALTLQQRLVALRKEEKIGDVLPLLEHKPVITLGRNAKAANVIASAELLAQRGVELFECDRGGDVTFHGPGQLVGYPIFDLRNYAHGAADALVRRSESRTRSDSVTPRKHLGAVDFVRRLEEILIRTCADFAIETKRIPGLTGVWTDAAGHDAHVGTAAPGCPVEQSSTAVAESTTYLRNELNREGHDFRRADTIPDTGSALAAAGRSEAKLAAIGIHISRFVTSHGFALNVNTDLSYFNLIVPCGIATKPVTSMQRELGRELDLSAVAESITRNLGVVFQTQILWLDTLDALLGGTAGVPERPLRKLHSQDETARA
jgi:lipoyl(octanoyl) transferase